MEVIKLDAESVLKVDPTQKKQYSIRNPSNGHEEVFACFSLGGTKIYFIRMAGKHKWRHIKPLYDDKKMHTREEWSVMFSAGTYRIV